MERVSQTEHFVLIETEDIDFSILRAAVKANTMLYKVRIKNNMHGYQRNQLIDIDASSAAEAIKIAESIDMFADVSIEQVVIK